MLNACPLLDLPPRSFLTLVSPMMLPESQNGHSAVYGAVHDRMTVFGGYDPNTSQGYQNALWLLKNASQSSLGWEGMGTLSGYALPTLGHTAVYDPVSNRMAIVGGIIQNGQGGIGWSNSVVVLTHANGLPVY